MPNPAAPPQLFVRTEGGQTFGPLVPATVELLVDNGVLKGKVRMSLDGVTFALPGNIPELRDHFSKALWEGDTDAARAAAPPSSAPVLVPPPPPPGRGQTPTPGNVPIAGPGAVQAAIRRGTPVPAAPARSAPPLTPAPPIAKTPAAQPGVSARPPPTGAPPPPGASAPPPPPPASAPPPPSVAPSPTVPPLPSQGDLASVSALRLYALAAAAEVSGVMELQLSDRAVQLHFRKGNADQVVSSHPEDGLGPFLVAQRLLNGTQLRDAQDASARFGNDLLAALFGLGILNPGNAFAPLAQRALGMMLKAWVSPTGRFTFHPRDVGAQKSLPLGNRWAILTDLLRRIPVPEVRRRLQDVLEQAPMKSGGFVGPSELKLTPQETRALGYFDGVRSVSQLLKDHAADADHLLRMTWLLREVDGLSFSAAAPRPAPPPPPVAASKPAAPVARPAAAAAARPLTPSAAPPVLTPPPVMTPPPPGPAAFSGAPVVMEAVIADPESAFAPNPGVLPPEDPSVVEASPLHAAPAPAPSRATPAASARAAPSPGGPPAPSAADVAAELAQVRKRAEEVKKQNHFQVLGLGQDTDSQAVKLAYFKLAKAYHPDTVHPGAPPELGKLKSDIFSAVGEAYRRLQDDSSRADYLVELKAGASEVDIEAILKGEELFQKGTILVKARKFPEALKHFEDAVKANASEAEFYAWRGYARFFASTDRKAVAPEAMREIQEALQKNERCAPAHYFLGHISKLMGDNATALKHFKRTVELDSHHIDAQRELRMMGAGTKR